MAPLPNEPVYPIAAVSKLTGVSCHALRIWERRYGFPIPHRSPSGHRRYDTEQVNTLLRLLRLSESGRTMGELIGEMLASRPESETAREPLIRPDEPITDPDLAEFMDRMTHSDRLAADDAFERLLTNWGVENLVTRLIAPALIETGERWFRRRYSVFHERCVSVYLRAKLDVMIDLARRTNAEAARTLIIGTVQGDRHEGGVLIASLFLEREGWRTISLGVDLPISEYAQAVKELKPDALALSFILSRNVNKRFHELKQIQGLPIFVGGRGILNYQTLARRNGLIPVAGTAAEAVRHLVREYDDWHRRHPSGSPN